MGVLDKNNNPPSFVPPATIAADRLKNLTRQTYQQMVQSFNRGSKMFWQSNSASPAEISAALGTDAKEIFELHYKLSQLLSSINPDAIAEGTSVIGNFTMNQDGTVTIN